MLSKDLALTSIVKLDIISDKGFGKILERSAMHAFGEFTTLLQLFSIYIFFGSSSCLCFFFSIPPPQPSGRSAYNQMTAPFPSNRVLSQG